MQQVKNIRQNETMVFYKNNSNIAMNKCQKDMINNDTICKLLKSEDDIENGRTRNAKEVIEEFRAKYGF